MHHINPEDGRDGLEDDGEMQEDGRNGSVDGDEDEDVNVWTPPTDSDSKDIEQNR